MKKIPLIVASLCLGLLSCGGAKDADKIGDAQFCLDKLPAVPTATEVDACMSPIEGMDSVGAQAIRCSAGFIREGFSNGSRFLQAFEAIDSGTDSSSMQALMGILTFASTNSVATNFSNASTTYSACLASGGKGSTLLASFTFLTMGLVRFFHVKAPGTCADTPQTHPTNSYRYYDLEDCASGAVSTAPLDVVQMMNESSVDADAIQVQTGLGAVIIGTSLISCGANASANNELCSVFANAITAAGGTGNTRRVAIEFFRDVLGLP